MDMLLLIWGGGGAGIIHAYSNDFYQVASKLSSLVLIKILLSTFSTFLTFFFQALLIIIPNVSRA